jgi:hypothetical protein
MYQGFSAEDNQNHVYSYFGHCLWLLLLWRGFFGGQLVHDVSDSALLLQASLDGQLQATWPHAVRGKAQMNRRH